MNTSTHSNTSQGNDTKDTLTGFARVGAGCGSVAEQTRTIRTHYQRKLRIVNVGSLELHLGTLAAGSTVMVATTAVLGNSPTAALGALNAAESAGVTLVVLDADKAVLDPQSAAAALLRASLATAAVWQDHAVRDAVPDLGPPRDRKGRPRALDDEGRQRVLEAPAAVSAADLAEELSVSVATIMRERRRIREAVGSVPR